MQQESPHSHTVGRDFPVEYQASELDETVIIGSITGDEWRKFEMDALNQHITIKTEDLLHPADWR